jgi:hypothetical protein
MPKLIAYKRPAAVTKSNWNGAPVRKGDLPRKALMAAKPSTPAKIPSLEQILHKH